MSRPLLIMAVLALLAATVAGHAQAAVFLVFSGTQGPPGRVIIAQTGGDAGISSVTEASPPVRVFLVRADLASEIRSADDRRLILLGRLRVDERGNGSLRFPIPNVAPGDYTTLIHCLPCARTSAGRALLPTGPSPGDFVVLDAVGDNGFPLLGVVLGAGAAVLVLGVTARWALLRRRAT